MEKRQELRNHKALRVALDMGHGPIYGNSENVSPKGIKLTLRNKRVFKPGTKVKVRISKDGNAYNLSGEVRWFRFEILSNSMGVEFENINSQFCDDVLHVHLDPEEQGDHSFSIDFASTEDLNQEYMESLRFGGLFIPAKGPMPDLNSIIVVEMQMPNKAETILGDARVVIHKDDGFGVMFTNTAKIDEQLKNYFQRSGGF